MNSWATQLSGAVVNAHFHLFWNTKLLSNVNNSDLLLSIRELSVEHNNLTEMLICAIRFEIGKTPRKLKHHQINKQTKQPSIAE